MMASQSPVSACTTPRSLVEGAVTATRTLRQRLPSVLVLQITSFLAGSSGGWHMDDAAAFAQRELLEILKRCQPWTTARLCTSLAMDWVVANGDLGTAEWIAANANQGCSPQAFYDAASTGRLHVLKWLFAHMCQDEQRVGIQNGVLYHAIQAGRVAIVEWLLRQTQHVLLPLFNVFEHACRCGHLSVVCVIADQPLWTKVVGRPMDTAAESGHLDVVKWLHRHRPSFGCTTDAMDLAAARGHLHVLRWLHANRTEGCTRRALLNAITGGHAAVVEWLLCQNFDWITQDQPCILQEATEFATFYDHSHIKLLLASRLQGPNQILPAGRMQMAV